MRPFQTHLTDLTSTTIQDLVLYEDEQIIIINKPHRLPLYKGPGGGPVLADYLDGLQGEYDEPPAPAHRLDASTSGCLVLGRSRDARRSVSDLFASADVKKMYWAVVDGLPLDDTGIIDLPLMDFGWPGRPRMRVDEAGKASQTRYQVLGRSDKRSWLALTPLTGRTHQLRVHCAGMDWPIIGDPLYHPEPQGEVHLHLHARYLSLPLQTAVSVEAEPPAHIIEALTDIVVSVQN
ncbi:MAG: RNA pseudouridine synthase [Magnetococcales bacterium]|nr:RNA pseudouridine synthase [Magnetococcales bacterium]